MSEKHAGGRPPKFESVEELEKAIDVYFSENVNYSISELAYELGFCSRQSLHDYEKRNSEFSYIIKRARLKVEIGYEKDLRDPDIKPTGAIFALKNMGWSDKVEQEITEHKITIVDPFDNK